MQDTCDKCVSTLAVSVTTFHTLLLTDTTLVTCTPSNAWPNKNAIYIHNHKYMLYTSKFIIHNIFHKILEAMTIIYGTKDLRNTEKGNWMNEWMVFGFETFRPDAPRPYNMPSVPLLEFRNTPIRCIINFYCNWDWVTAELRACVLTTL